MEGAPPGRTGAGASGRRGGAERSAARPRRRWRTRGRAGENGAAGGAPSRQGATPRRDPGDCNDGRLPLRSVKRWSGNQRAEKPTTCGLEIKTPREEKQGRCRSMGQRKWPATPLPERGTAECRGRDRAGAEECPGASPAYRLMGWRAGIPPPGETGGRGKSCKGRDGHPSGRREPCLPPLRFPK